MLVVSTKAKLNLSLNIIGKRVDGYHLLHSVVAFCDVGDRLSVAPSDDISLTIEGIFGEGLCCKINLVMRAATLLKQVANVTTGAKFHLIKNLPIASGIGGGSGDAAAALLLLRQLWKLELSDDALAKIGATLGADVPVCLHGRACIMEGIGEKLNPVDLGELYAVLVNPLQALATPDVFANLNQVEWTPPSEKRTDVSAFHNDLQPAAQRLCPEITDILHALHQTPHCIAARLSGSGATCFGLYETLAQATHAVTVMQGCFPNYWVASGTIS